MEMKDSRMIVIRRFVAGTIDVVIALLSSLLTYLYIRTQLTMECNFYFLAWCMYFVPTIIFPIAYRYGTIGDRLFKIINVHIDGRRITLFKLLLKNFLLWFLLGMTFPDFYDEYTVWLYRISIFLMYIVILSNKNKYKENMTAMDMLFKTKYILQSNE